MFAISVLSSRPVLWLLHRVGFMLNADQGSWTQLFAIAGRGFNATLSGTYLEPIAKKGAVKMPTGGYIRRSAKPAVGMDRGGNES